MNFTIPAVCLALSVAASAADFPEKPLRFDNKPGANDFIGAGEAARAAPGIEKE
ncbi:hypothetical protein [Massilia sp. TWR1-2-2]|uniref:hypothetical protein n=1 Tax=Massilia sp. TWR1-2-2 TaxID=2804584 RepID=UPI003CEA116F